LPLYYLGYLYGKMGGEEVLAGNYHPGLKDLS